MKYRTIEGERKKKYNSVKSMLKRKWLCIMICCFVSPYNGSFSQWPDFEAQNLYADWICSRSSNINNQHPMKWARMCASIHVKCAFKNESTHQNWMFRLQWILSIQNFRLLGSRAAKQTFTPMNFYLESILTHEILIDDGKERFFHDSNFNHALCRVNFYLSVSSRPMSFWLRNFSQTSMTFFH